MRVKDASVTSDLKQYKCKKNKFIKGSYRRHGNTSRTANFHSVVRFIMYYFITTCSVESCWHCSDETVLYKSNYVFEPCWCRPVLRFFL